MHLQHTATYRNTMRVTACHCKSLVFHLCFRLYRRNALHCTWLPARATARRHRCWWRPRLMSMRAIWCVCVGHGVGASEGGWVGGWVGEWVGGWVVGWVDGWGYA